MTINREIGIQTIENSTRRNLSKLLRLYLVQPAAINPTLGEKLSEGDALQRFKNLSLKSRIFGKSITQRPLRIEH